MSEERKNIRVAVFVIVGLVILFWLIFQLGTLPAIVSRYEARIVTVQFPAAPNVHENTVVLFLGYRVGNVIDISPPAVMPDVNNPQQRYYQVSARLAISLNYPVPDNVIPKIYHRGLGASYVELTLPDYPSSQMLQDGAVLKGYVSGASEFLTEDMQHKLDRLLDSLTALSSGLEYQLTLRPPELVDQGEPNKVYANITTAIMRVDQAFKNLNLITGDAQNQKNIKEGLADINALAAELRLATEKFSNLTTQAQTVLQDASHALASVDSLAGQANVTVKDVGAGLENAADEFARTMANLNEIFVKLSTGKGSAALALNDPQLYEALTDASRNLSLALAELRGLIDELKKKGLKTKLQLF